MEYDCCAAVPRLPRAACHYLRYCVLQKETAADEYLSEPDESASVSWQAPDSDTALRSRVRRLGVPLTVSRRRRRVIIAACRRYYRTNLKPAAK